MKRLIIINYQREIPPFLINDIKVARRFFDSVDFITPVLYKDNSDTIKTDNVSIVQCKRKNKFLDKIKAVFMLLRSEILSEIFCSIQEHRFSLRFLKHMSTYTYTSLLVLNKLRRLINKYKNDEVVVLSAWYSVEAYILSRLKRAFPFIKSVSFAHSFEIDNKKNAFVGLSLDSYKAKNIDKIVFISKTMQEIYNKTTNYKFENRSKEIMRYLGSMKLFDETNPSIKDDCFKICSCSGVIPVKRIDLIIEALKKWDGPKIHWTHLGGGPLLEEMRLKANEIKNNNVSVDFLGWLTNQEVQKYYTKHHFDLLVNVSASEGLPVSIMEACSYGIPCLATDVGGTREIVDEKTGVLVSENITSIDLKNAVYEFLSRDEEVRSNIRKNCVSRWEKCFDTEKNATNFYKNL